MSVRLGRGRLVAVEAALGAAVGGVAVGGAVGWPVAACGGLALCTTLARSRGQWLTDRVHGWPRPVPAAPGSTGGMGALTQVAPRLGVAECADRNGAPLGVAWDGQGFAAAVELDATMPLRIDLAALARQVAQDDAEVASVQLLVEQVRVPPLDAQGFEPTASYRWQAPADLVLVHRVWMALRHEPIWAPHAAARRGAGGADGARLALGAALARLRVFLTGRGLSALPLDAAAMTQVLRTVGDPSAAGQVRDDAWVTPAATHHCLGAAVGSGEDWTGLLSAAAASPAERSVVSVAADVRRVRTSAAVRLVAANPAAAGRARAALLSHATVRPLTGDQAAGVLATLPLGGGARPLHDAIGWSAR